MSSTNKKEAMSFTRTVPAGSEPIKITERIKGEGTVEQVKVRFFKGQQLALRVRPYIQHHGNKIEDLIVYPEGTNQYLSGDDDYVVYEIVCPVQNDDELVIWAHNTDPDDDYTLNVSVLIDYYGGEDRVI